MNLDTFPKNLRGAYLDIFLEKKSVSPVSTYGRSTILPNVFLHKIFLKFSIYRIFGDHAQTCYAVVCFLNIVKCSGILYISILA
jgi:hypothetical protein